jgi:tubulin-specific chaperone B
MMTGADIAQLRAYVQGPDSGMQNRDAATVLLHVSHSNLAARFMEIRVDMHVRQCIVIVLACNSALPVAARCRVLVRRYRANRHEPSVQTTVDALKTKLMTHCGTSPSAMHLQLKDERGRLQADLDPARPLGFYSPRDGCSRLRLPASCVAVRPCNRYNQPGRQPSRFH